MPDCDSRDTASLVARSRDGDRAAVEALVRMVQPAIYRLAQRFLMVPEDAEDATQEILLKIITRLGQFDGKSRFTTWAYAVATNHLRDVKRRPIEGAMTLAEFGDDLSEGLAESPYEGPEAARMLEEVRIGCTLAMLQCLEQEARLAYILGEILELDHTEASDVLGVSAPTYRKRLSRARAAITAFMREHCGLIESANPCRCSKRVLRAQALGRVDSEHFVFASSARVARQFPEVLAEIRQLEGDQRSAALYRAQKQPQLTEDFRKWLEITLRRQEERRSGDRVQ